jgi:ElaB/YqjD/DUF883 family membrane-anchored ribosome-binding protein
MADRNNASSSMIASGGGTERAHAADMADRHDGSVITEFVDAARSAAESLLEEQKRQIADTVEAVGEALRCATHPLEQSQTRIVARYVEDAANRVHSLSHTMRARRWGELVADTEDYARRNPTVFVLSSVAVGFVLGRLLWMSTSGRQHQAAWSSGGGEPARSVTAAVASATGTAGREPAGDAAARTGASEAR